MEDFVQAKNTKATPESFAKGLGRYKNWRDELARAIADYQVWVEQQGLSEGEEDLRVYELIESLKSDKLTVALVAEFSRGKTELLNAIFFADYKQRLLPSTAGRTTMCPTELRYDEKDGPCIKLLPIETRKTAVTIAEYKRTPVHWTTLHILKLSSTEEVSEAFLEVTKTKMISVREAQELGLYSAQLHSEMKRSGDMVEVPVWRHAIINFPHPLLKQGLVLLDTPGLNSLGSEPELTLSLLPNAQAIIFVLAADTGVTKTDHDMWTDHVNTVKGSGHIIALNKIDILWDELHDEATIARSVARQIDETAYALRTDKKNIFPVSAQKGLLGKIKADQALVEKSGLAALEKKLTEDIIPFRHMIIRNRIVHEISGRIETSRGLLDSKLVTIDNQLANLKSLGGKNLNMIQKMVAHIRHEKQKYDKELEGFQLTRATLSKQAQVLFSHLSIKIVDELIKKSRSNMEDSWTTRGLKTGMASFFTGAVEQMEKVNKETDSIRAVVDSIYHRLHTEYGLPVIIPTKFSMLSYILQLKKLEENAAAFRNSPMTTMTEQHFVIKKFFITLVSQARQIFNECEAASKVWFQAVVSPVFTQVQQHKAAIDRNFEALKKIHENMDSLGDRIDELEDVKKDVVSQLKITEALLERIHRPLF